MRGRFIVLLFLLGLSAVLPGNALAVDDPNAPEDAVYGVLFYLPSCPHCHDVIDNHLPDMFDSFGDKFRVVMIDAGASQDAGRLMQRTCATVGVPMQDCGGVPLMVIGDEYMIGSYQIPNEAPGIIRDGIESGGIPLPDVAGMDSFDAQVHSGSSSGTDGETSTTIATTSTSETVWDRLAADPAGNTLAIVVLLLLVASLGGALYLAWDGVPDLPEWGRRGALISIGVAMITALSLAVGDVSAALPTTLAGGSLLLLAAAFWLALKPGQRDAVVPLVTLAGLLVAAYLTHVETTSAAAVCGTVGDCGTVQQSAYAELFGVLPVGLLGIIGYVLIFGTWLWKRQTRSALAQAALFGMAAFGTAFSIYLTFLEPFVIGATCAWCLTSALTMVALLWLTIPEGFPALRRYLNLRDSTPQRA